MEKGVGRIGGQLYGKQFADFLYDLAWTGIPQTICLDLFLSVNVNAKLSEPAFDRFSLDITILVQLGRHTGGHSLLDRSDGAVVDRYFFHRVGCYCCSGWKSSTGFPEGSSSMTSEPPGPVAMSFRK